MHKKGLYFDGHERQDVIEYQQVYLRKLEILQSTHLSPPTCSTGQTEEIIGNETAEKLLVLIYHDESSLVFIQLKGNHGNGLNKKN